MPEPIEFGEGAQRMAQRMAAEHNAKLGTESILYVNPNAPDLSDEELNSVEWDEEAADLFEDSYGIVDVFAAHLQLSLQSMSPPEAFEAAAHATRHHLRSYDFLTFNHKGSQDVEYRMVRKRSSASSARSATENIQTKPVRGGDAIENAR